MRLFEECPYITPCGWCSRQNKPCEIEEKKKCKKEQKAGANNARE